MKIFRNFLAIVLMSMVATVALAQAPLIERAELNADNIAYIKGALAKNSLHPQDSLRIQILLSEKNDPIEGVFNSAENPYVQKGDEWVAYISFERGCYWLAYVVRRGDEFICRYCERID